jgi:hypothetical protein
LITHAGAKNLYPAIFEHCVQLAFDAKKHVALVAPVIRKVSGGVFHNPDANTGEVPGAPVCYAVFTGVSDRFYSGPVGCLKWNIRKVHALS